MVAPHVQPLTTAAPIPALLAGPITNISTQRLTYVSTLALYALQLTAKEIAFPVFKETQLMASVPQLNLHDSSNPMLNILKSFKIVFLLNYIFL
jgi:hypothetical protein